MMDPRPLFPRLFHFVQYWRTPDLRRNAKHYTRTRCPTKYYYIDFGLSRRYDPATRQPLERPIWGADRSVPEFHKSLKPCDPFPTDIYYLGNVMRSWVLEVSSLGHVDRHYIHTCSLQEYEGLDFMQPLVSDMVQDDPEKRPTIDEVVGRFDILMGSLSTWRLRSRLPMRGEHWLMRSFRAIAHVFRTIYYILTLRPALPRL